MPLRLGIFPRFRRRPRSTERVSQDAFGDERVDADGVDL
jgi:hypothetical protein